MINKVDPKWLVDSFAYHEYLGKDSFGERVFAEPVNIEKVRIDYSTVYSQNKTESKVIANAVIFCFASATTPFLNFKKESKVGIGVEEYIITKIIPNKEPRSNNLWSYELEMV